LAACREVHIELAGQFILGVLDLQAASGAPPAGTQASRPDRKLICGKAPVSRKPAPASSRPSTGGPVLTAVVLAARRAVESSIGFVIRTPPFRNRRPRTAGRQPAR
jgi:hypothetical protein